MLPGDLHFKNFPGEHAPRPPQRFRHSALNFTGYLPTHKAVPFYFKSYWKPWTWIAGVGSGRWRINQSKHLKTGFWLIGCSISAYSTNSLVFTRSRHEQVRRKYNRFSDSDSVELITGIIDPHQVWSAVIALTLLVKTGLEWALVNCPGNNGVGGECNSFPCRRRRNFPSYFALYTLTLVCIFSILFSIHFWRSWEGEFLEQSWASLVFDDSLYSDMIQ